MLVDLEAYRANALVQSRIRDRFRLVPDRGISALDIGCRDGYLSTLLVDRSVGVIALDLEKSDRNHPGVERVQGDPFGSYDQDEAAYRADKTEAASVIPNTIELASSNLNQAA